MARIVIQRVRAASVTIDGETVGSIGTGLVILIGIKRGDDEAAVLKLADKTATLRIFRDGQGKMNLSAAEANGDMLVVSQFTLYGDLRKGRRPSFIDAADPAEGDRLYQCFMHQLASHGLRVECGRFGAEMLVNIENDGPVTIVLDSQDL